MPEEDFDAHPSRQCARDPGAARPEAFSQELADRGAAADAHEQSRSGGGREAPRARGLWRHRPRRARLAKLRSHRRRTHRARGGRDAVRAIRQAGRRISHPPRRTARADRQLEPGAALGDARPFQRTRPQGPDDVRPDDCGLVDLHRLAGHRAGHLRDIRRDRAAPLWRQPCRPVDSHRRSRRHGRRAAAGRDHGGRIAAGDRMPALAHRDAAAAPAISTPGQRTWTKGSR